MPIMLDYRQARDLLNNAFLSAEQHIASGSKDYLLFIDPVDLKTRP